jgi:hypothetical protein
VTVLQQLKVAIENGASFRQVGMATLQLRLQRKPIGEFDEPHRHRRTQNRA